MDTRISTDEILKEFPGSTIIDEPSDPVLHTRHFLELLYGDWKKNFPGRFFEIRLLGGRVEQQFYTSPDEFLLFDLPKLLELQERERFGIYFGVCPRDKKCGKNEDISIVPALWADLDGETAKSIFEFKPAPDIIVFSGNGYHGFWLLKTSALANESTRKILRSIQKACGSDSVSDFARVMRLPGSLNLKNPAAPKICRMIFISGGISNAI